MYVYLIHIRMNIFSFWPYHGAWGILVLQPGTEPEPPAWKHGVLPLGQQASHCTHIFNVFENSLDCNCDTILHGTLEASTKKTLIHTVIQMHRTGKIFIDKFSLMCDCSDLYFIFTKRCKGVWGKKSWLRKAGRTVY